MVLWKGHVSEHVVLGLPHKLGKFIRRFGKGIDQLLPLLSCRLAVGLLKGVPERGRNHSSVTLTDEGERVSHEVDAAALPGSTEHFGCGGLEPLVRVADDELDPAQARRVSERRNSVQNASASEGITVMPSTSRRPCALTATAMITAAETILPPSRTFT